MAIKTSRVKKINKNENTIFFTTSFSQIQTLKLSKEKESYLKKNLTPKNKIIEFNEAGVHQIFVLFETTENEHKDFESIRKSGHQVFKKLNAAQVETCCLNDLSLNEHYTYYFTEGFILSSYQFLKYKTKHNIKPNVLKQLKIVDSCIGAKQLNELKHIADGVCFARDLVNEPLNYLTAPQLGKEFKTMAKKGGLKVEVFNKKKIESLKMGGLLAVNKGSIDPPSFTILEWKPAKHTNKQPLILVGKGVVYDTGGLSLKQTKGGMDHMKCDMGGAAAVGAAMYTIAQNKLPLHVIALIPATDNRPGGNAYVPGDVIKMHSGSTVEVLNTDAEGRMILADALSYAKKYKPMLVIDVATLTGSALRAIGQYGIVCMGNAHKETKAMMKNCSYKVYERLAELPFWEEYGEEIKSEIADIKNTGGNFAGAITAGKFLEHFVDYPWMHFDIAPSAYNYKAQSYRPKNGTGMGVRLLYEIAKTLSKA